MEEAVLTWSIPVFGSDFTKNDLKTALTSIIVIVCINKATAIVMCDEKLIAGFSSAMQSVDNCS